MAFAERRLSCEASLLPGAGVGTARGCTVTIVVCVDSAYLFTAVKSARQLRQDGRGKALGRTKPRRSNLKALANLRSLKFQNMIYSSSSHISRMRKVATVLQRCGRAS